MSKIPDEAFRDTIGTIDEEGKRNFIFPKKPSGKFYDYRKWVSYLLLIILVANPFIKINGNQFMMFNVLERKFNIFGFPFWPQDFYLFVLFMIVGVVFVIASTVVGSATGRFLVCVVALCGEVSQHVDGMLRFRTWHRDHANAIQT